jgi:predicted RNA binding protein YcfA (HicA-like mRNA interferase family)
MKRIDLIRHITAQGCQLLREGGRHTIYWNPASRSSSSVPRHTEIVERLAKKICKDLGVPTPS